MTNIVPFTGITQADEPPEQVLEKAKSWGLSEVVIVGCNGEGDLVWGGSLPDMEMINWLLEAAKFELLRKAFAKE